MTYFPCEGKYIRNTGTKKCISVPEDYTGMIQHRVPSVWALAGRGSPFNSSPHLSSGKTRAGGWEGTRGDQDAEEKIKFLAPAGCLIRILQPVACADTLKS
jgi:hypothetical protein